MRLPGTIEERLQVIHAERRLLLREVDVAELEDDGIRVDCSLAGVTTCIQLRLKPNDVQFLRERVCADFALLLARGDDAFEAHVLELKKSVGEKDPQRAADARRWAEARRSWERGRIHLKAFARDVEHHRIPADTGPATRTPPPPTTPPPGVSIPRHPCRPSAAGSERGAGREA